MPTLSNYFYLHRLMHQQLGSTNLRQPLNMLAPAEL